MNTDTHLRGGMACPVIIKVGKSQKTHFVTSSDVVANLEATGYSNPTEMHPFPKKKMKRCPVEAKSFVNNFGDFSFLSMNIDSSPGLKKYPEVTCLDFQAPEPNLESDFEAYTFVDSEKVKLKFEYNGASGKHVFKCPSDKPKEHFYLGAPVIIENKDETCKLSSKRWPVVGVVGRDKELEPCLYFVTANMFAGKFCWCSFCLIQFNMLQQGVSIKDLYWHTQQNLLTMSRTIQTLKFELHDMCHTLKSEVHIIANLLILYFDLLQ